MTIGPTPTQTGVNLQAQQLALNLRNACRAAQEFNEWILAYGTTNLEGIGFSPADATSMTTDASYMNTVAGVFFGTATQGTDFNFDNAICLLYGGA